MTEKPVYHTHQMLDAEKPSLLKIREILEQVGRMNSVPDHKMNTTTLVAVRILSAEALALINAFIDSVPDLKVPLMNSIQPEYNFHATCNKCGEETETNNGEWLLWCGEKHHAEAILSAARQLHNAVRK